MLRVPRQIDDRYELNRPSSSLFAAEEIAEEQEVGEILLFGALGSSEVHYLSISLAQSPGDPVSISNSTRMDEPDIASYMAL